MCFSGFFFDLLTFYFFLLSFATISRKQITYKGIFYIFTTFLFFFSLYLVQNFSSFVAFNTITEFNLQMNTVTWHSLNLTLSLRCDTLSYLFVLLVTIIGLGTNMYTLNYMKYEANEDIFALLINWFMFSMILLVLANNLFTLFLGWESIGLSSFFLINFWSTRRGTIKSSFKAFFFNKMSDVFLFIFLVLINSLLYVNSLHLLNIKLLVNLTNFNTTYQFAGFCLFACTLFKSAQLFGHLWLPDSMEAPVPASALIHSATLVSAGIYLLMRFTPIVTLNNLHVIAFYIGSLTAAYGAIVSASQTDMKKLLAYSTISHCGFLFVTLSTELYSASIIYLFLHGLFKALTFFCAGTFIRVSGTQDTRFMGNLSRILPVDTIFLIICAFNLGGLPFSLGYLYKSSLLVVVLHSNTSIFCLGFCLIGLLSSVVYVYRLVYYSCFDTTKDFFLQLIYELQQKQINVVRYWSLTSIVQILAVYAVFLFSMVIYMYFLSYFTFSDLVFESTPITLEGHNYNLGNSIQINKHFYEFFYNLYTLIIILISTLVWRYEYTYMFRINFIVNFGFFCYFFVIYTTIFNF